MTDTDKLELYIHNTFSKITDNEGKPLDVTLAMPVFKQILTEYNQEILSSKFDYIGESALQFAINLILVQKYSKYDNQVLSVLAKKFRVPLQLYKYIGKHIHLKEYVRSIYLKEKMDMILGVLYHYYGIIAVQSFIEKTFVFFVDCELDSASSSKRIVSPSITDDNPVKILYEMTQAGSGQIQTHDSETPDKKWQVRIVAKLNDKSLLFSHARTSTSKQKAKTEASRDILTYFTNNPHVCQQLQLPGDGNAEVHALPISEKDYCHLFAENTPTTKTKKPVATGDWDYNIDCTHLSQESHEEATLLLENLLLDNRMDVDTDPRQVKRQRQASFPNFSQQNGSVQVKAEPVQGSLPLQSLPNEQDPSGSNIAYIKDEETFQLFNQTDDLPVDEATAVRNEKVLRYFRKLFAAHRLVLLQCRTTPGQSKTVFLSFVVQHKDEMVVDITIQQGGDSHTPLFHAAVVLRSKTKDNVFIKTNGSGRRKKDAEQQAFNKMIEIVTNWNAMI